MSTTYYHKGKEVTDRNIILKRYFTKQFFYDIFPLLPFILDIFLVSFNHNYLQWLFPLCFLKLRKIIRTINALQDKFHLMERLSQQIQLLKLVIINILIIHYFSTLWLFISQYNENNWIQQNDLVNQEWIIKYLNAYYYITVTILTIGYGDIKPSNSIEMMLCIFIALVGCGVFAYSMNEIGQIIQSLREESKEIKKNLYTISKYMHNKNISSKLQTKIKQYLLYYWQEENKQKQNEEFQVIHQLSDSLKEKLALQANHLVVYDSHIFKSNFSQEILKKIVYVIKEIRFTPEENIYTQGTQDEAILYFIQKGSVQVFLDQTKEIQVLKKGSYFGSVGFFTGQSRAQTAKSVGFTTLLGIKRADFLHILKEYPLDYEKYCQIKDLINIYKDNSKIDFRCYSCQSFYHLLHECPYLHFKPNKFRVIQRENVIQKQEVKFKKRRNKKYHTLLLHKQAQSAALELFCQKDDQFSQYSNEEFTTRTKRVSTQDILKNEHDSNIASDYFIELEQNSFYKENEQQQILKQQKFEVQFYTNFNQYVKVVGNIDALGKWDPQQGLSLITSPQIYPNWTHDFFIEVPLETQIEFKCVLYEFNNLIRWEQFSYNQNRVFKPTCFKTLIFIRQDNIQIIERPFQKYNANLDNDIIDISNVRKFKNEQILFDPLYNASVMSSSSGSSSQDFFRKQSHISENEDEDALSIENKKYYNLEMKQITNIKKVQSRNSSKSPDKHSFKHISSTQKNLNQLNPKSNTNLQNIQQIFNRIKKQTQTNKDKYPPYINHIQNMRQNEYEFLKLFRSKSVKSSPSIEIEYFKQNNIILIVSYQLPIVIKRHQNNINKNNFEYVNYTDNKFFDSIYTSLNFLKIKFLWIGISNIYTEKENEQKEIRDVLLQQYKCVPFFLNAQEGFDYQFFSRFFNNSPDQEQLLQEEDQYWAYYKQINEQMLKFIQQVNHQPLSLIFLDYYFMLIPSLFLQNLNPIDENNTIIAYCFDYKFPFCSETLPYTYALVNSLYFSHILSFNTCEDFEPFLKISIKNGCSFDCKTGGKTSLTINGRRIQIFIQHSGIDLIKLAQAQQMYNLELNRRLRLMKQQNKFFILGIDPLSKNSGIELKINIFANFLTAAKKAYPHLEFKLQQIVYLNSYCEFSSLQEQLQYLAKLKDLAKKKASQNINIIQANNLSINDYIQYQCLSQVFFSTSIQQKNGFCHYLEYLYLRKNGVCVLTNCIPQMINSTQIYVLSPFNSEKIIQVLVKTFEKQIYQENQMQKYNEIEFDIVEEQVEQKRLKTAAFLKNIQDQTLYNHNYIIKFFSNQHWSQDFLVEITKMQLQQTNNFHIQSCLEERKVFLQNKSQREVVYKPLCMNKSTQITLNLKNMYQSLKLAKNPVFIFTFGSIYEENQEILCEIRKLSSDPLKTVYILTKIPLNLIEEYVGEMPNCIIIANNGQKVKEEYEYLTLTKMYEHLLWKPYVIKIMENFTSKTDGSFIIDYEVETTWNCSKCEKQFAKVQKIELVKQLLQIIESMPGNQIVEGEDFVLVRPCCLNKLTMIKLALKNSFQKKGKIDFLFVVGSNKYSDEEIFQTIREYITQGNMFEMNPFMLLSSMSEQQGAKNSNYQFKNAQDFIEVLQVLNGEKQNYHIQERRVSYVNQKNSINLEQINSNQFFRNRTTTLDNNTQSYGYIETKSLKFIKQI